MIQYEHHRDRLRALIRYESEAIAHQIKMARAKFRVDRERNLYDERPAAAAKAQKKQESRDNYLRNIIRRNAEAKARFGANRGAVR